MKLWDSVEILVPFPAVYIPSLDTIVMADLHLGYEGIMAEQGVFLPKIQFRLEVEMLERIREICPAGRILLNGDVKHEFSETGYHEFLEVRDLFSLLVRSFEEVLVVKGNHDNYLIRTTKRFGITPRERITLGNFHFCHGHRPVDVRMEAHECLIIAHEHPSILLTDEVGGREKLPCLLYGEFSGRRIIVLPAFSPLAEGSQVNIVPPEELLSPVLREEQRIDRLRAIGLSREVGALEFPEIGRMRF
ncbi:MAG: metallophosphoesterase [Methanomicrobiales archaeon]|nr:metallophosphoesterase [Methanomicrobiales archaeon]